MRWSRGKALLRPSLRLIGLVSLIVPRRLRDEWRREWEAELHYREELLDRWYSLDWRRKFDLLRHSLGAFWDALWLQPRRLEDEMFQDLWFGLRMFLKEPGFTLIAMFTIALGVGVNTAIFSLADKLLIRSLPVREPGKLVLISAESVSPRFLNTIFSYPDYIDYRDRNEALSGLIAFIPIDGKLE